MGSGCSRPVEEENQAEPQELRTVTLRFKIDKQPMFTEHPITDGVVPEVFVMLDEFDYEDMGLLSREGEADYLSIILGHTYLVAVVGTRTHRTAEGQTSHIEHTIKLLREEDMERFVHFKNRLRNDDIRYIRGFEETKHGEGD